MAEDTTTQHQASRSPVGATTGTGGAA
jgi:hypothetical protein